MKKKLRVVSNIISWIFLILVDVLLCVYYYMKKYLGLINMYQIAYHLSNNIEGRGTFKVFFDATKSCLLQFILILIIELILFVNYKKFSVAIEHKKSKKDFVIYPTIFARYKLVFSFILLIGVVGLLLHLVKFKEFYDAYHQETEIYENYYVDTNDVKIEFGKDKKNLILIYLESMEASLFSKDNNGYFNESRIPELEKVAKNNISFSNTNGMGGMYVIPASSYTMGSLVVSSSSTPLLVKLGNNYNSFNSILPKVRTLGDVLRDEGYNLEFMQGSDMSFAGEDKYFVGHGNYEIFDYYAAIDKGLISKDYYVWWGFEDKKLFDYAKEELNVLSNKEEPFALTITSMDTHFYDGYVDSSCSNNFPEHLSNSYACSSKMVNEFLEWLKLQPYYDDTVIVLVGDHTTMQTSFFKDDPDYVRTIYNVFINSNKKNVNYSNRISTIFDLYPSIISALGANIEGDRIGFGTNLFSDKKTITEEIGLWVFSGEISKHSDYYDNYIN